MPELPEVETVKNKLLPSLKNKTIKSVEVYYEKHSSLRQIKDEKILDIKRKGKHQFRRAYRKRQDEFQQGHNLHVHTGAIKDRVHNSRAEENVRKHLHQKGGNSK